jgi:hypothetical protein
MAITVATPVSFGIKSLGTGSFNVQWASATISTNGWVFAIIFGNTGGALTADSLVLSTDGTLSHTTTQLNRGADTRGRFFGLPASTAATQTITANFSNGDNTGSAELVGWDVSGTFNTTTMFGGTLATTDATDPDQQADIVTNTANAAILCSIQGGNSEPGAVTSSGLTFVDTDTGNAQRRAWSSHCADSGTAGTKTLNWSQGDFFNSVELQASSAVGLNDDDQWPRILSGPVVAPLVSLW